MVINYLMPTKILLGKKVIDTHKELLKNYGEKAYIITGKKSSKVNGSYGDVVKALEEQRIDYTVFDDIEENPSLETIERAAELGKREKVDFIIGIGGGSPLDASKAIGIFINNEGVNKENIFNIPALKSLPIIAVPTTSGTGSEVTPYAIVTDHKAKTKKNLGQIVFPEIAFLDPSYTENMPYSVTVNTAVDAFSHLAEGYLNANASLITDMYAEKGIELFGQCLKSLLDNSIDYSVREKLMLSSTLGGMLIAQTGTSLPHGMGYALTYFKGVPHGMANGILFGEYLKVFKNKDKVNNILRLMNLQSLDELQHILSLLLKLNIEITEEDIIDYTKSMVENKAKLKNHPENIEFEDIFNIYKNSLL